MKNQNTPLEEDLADLSLISQKKFFKKEKKEIKYGQWKDEDIPYLEEEDDEFELSSSYQSPVTGQKISDAYQRMEDDDHYPAKVQHTYFDSSLMQRGRYEA